MSRPRSCRWPGRRPPWRRRRSPSSGPSWRRSCRGRSGRRAGRTARRIASHRSRSLAEAAPSVPRATGTPAASNSGIRANPLPSFWLEAGQWATAAPLEATRARSSSVRWTPWASTVPGPSRPVSREHLDRRAAVALAGRLPARRRSRRRGRGRARRARPPARRPLASCGSSSRYVPCGHTHRRAGRRGGQQLAGPRHALVEAPPVGAGELDEHRTGAQVEAGCRGDGRRRLREEVHVERRGDPGAEALGDGECGACRDGRLGEDVALGREESSQEAVEVDVVGEAAEHRHRQVGVSVDEPGQDDAAAGVDHAVGDAAAAGPGSMVVIVSPSTSTLARSWTVPPASIVTTVALTIGEVSSWPR